MMVTMAFTDLYGPRAIIDRRKEGSMPKTKKATPPSLKKTAPKGRMPAGHRMK